ncbi:MAG TPA: hypothetical protein VHF06_25135 [Pseudonocardiaceae bacterium]|jgi:hypothetical protein|nr:hypothetical protein [Pseudonocardiaceae bacterium]
MHRSIVISRAIVLAGGVVQLVLGLLFWSGTAKALEPVHMAIGTIVVVSLIVLAAMALKAGAPKPLGVLAIVWALVVLAVGASQKGILTGSLHWVVQVIHLLLGIGAMGLASIVAARVLPAKAKVDWAQPDPAER